MKTHVKEILVKQAKWQKLRKAASWGDKIRQAEIARDSLGGYGYRPSSTCHDMWSLRGTGEKGPQKAQKDTERECESERVFIQGGGV